MTLSWEADALRDDPWEADALRDDPWEATALLTFLRRLPLSEPTVVYPGVPLGHLVVYPGVPPEHLSE